MNFQLGTQHCVPRFTMVLRYLVNFSTQDGCVDDVAFTVAAPADSVIFLILAPKILNEW